MPGCLIVTRYFLIAASLLISLPALAQESPLHCKEGYAAVRLTIRPDGMVRNVEVLDEQPRWCGLGQQASVAARRFLFEARPAAGDERATYVMRFEPDPANVSAGVFSVASAH